MTSPKLPDGWEIVSVPDQVALPDGWEIVSTPTPEPGPIPVDPGVPALSDVLMSAMPQSQPVQMPQDEPLSAALDVPQTPWRSRTEIPDEGLVNLLAQPQHGFMPDVAPQPVQVDPGPSQPASDYLKRAGRGAVEVAAALPEGAALAGAGNPNAAALVASEIVLQAQGNLAAATERLERNPDMNAEDRARVDAVIADSTKQIQSYQPLADIAEGPLKPAAADRPLFQIGDALRDAATDVIGAPDPQYDERFGSKLAEGAGNMAGFVTTSLLTGPLGTTAAGSALNASQVYKEARNYGATEEEAMQATRWAGMLGATEAIPITRALDILPKQLRGEVANKLAQRLLQVFKSSGEEAAQEAIVGIGNNIIALTGYDPERGVMDNVGEQALIGAILGGAVNVGGQTVDAMRVPPVPPQDDDLSTLVNQAILDATPQVPSNEGAVVAPRIAPNQPEPPREDLPPDERDRGSLPGTDGAGTVRTVDTPGSSGAVAQSGNGDVEGGGNGGPTFTSRRNGSADRSGLAVDVESRIGSIAGDQRTGDLNGAEPVPSEQASPDVELPPAPETPQKKPLTSQFWRSVGQVDPASDLAQELYSQDINPRTAPRLFAKGGLKNFDNIPANEHPEIAQIVGEDGNGYLDPNGITNALVNEQREPAPIGRQAAVQDQYKAWEQEVAAIERGEGYEADPDYALPEGATSWRVTAPDQDISTGIERLDMIERLMIGYEQESGVALTPQERQFMLSDLDRRGGPIEASMERALIEDIGYAKTGTEPAQAKADQVPDADQGNTGQSEDPAGAQAESAGRSETSEPAREGTTEGGRVDLTPEGEQTVIPGAEKITDKEQAERQQQKPKRGGDAPPPAGGLFDDDARNQQSLLDASASVGRRPKGKLSPGFLDFSYTSRPSVFNHAFNAAGIDPDKGKLMSLDEQLSIVRKAVEREFGVKVELPKIKVQKKNRFGRKVVEEQTDLSGRKALDQLLNAYRQMQMLAHIMGLPAKAIGLPVDGQPPLTLSLVSNRSLRNALGMYAYGPGQRTIFMPDMSNSFAHEWGHALDHYLGLQSDKPLLKGLLSRDQNLAGAPLSPKRALTEAFAHVIWSMYGDSSQAGAIVLKAQVDSAQIGANGKPTPKAVRAQKVLNDIRAGKTPPAEYLSDYFKTSKAYDDQTERDGYFTDPAEMFARAFEAMVGIEVAKVSDQPQAFLSKGEWAYADSQDARAALTFPKDVDLKHFTLAMVNLQQAMSRISLHGANAPANAPETHDTTSARQLLNLPKEARIGSLTRQEIAEWGRTLELMSDLPDKAKTVGQKVVDGADLFHSQIIRTSAATAFALADRQTNPKARAAFENIAKLIGKRPGRGKLVENIWEQDVRQKSAVYVNKIEGALRKALVKRKGGRLSKADQSNLNSLLSGQLETSGKPEIDALAVDLRVILNDIWYDLQNQGIKVGYASQYLPHIYDAQKATEHPDKFKAQAAKVYDLMFEREVANNPDTDTQMKDMKAILRGLMNATDAMPDGSREPAPRVTEGQQETVQNYFDAVRELNALSKKLPKLKSDKAIEATETRIAEIEDGMEDLLGEALDVLGPAWSEYSAEKWLIRMGTGQLNDFDSIGPTANFMDERVLPNEAGYLLREFMQDNPIELVTNYAISATKRAEFARVFGDDGSKLTNMLDAAEGATKEEKNTMKAVVNASTGRIQSPGTGMQAFHSTTFSLGNMSLLTLASFSSLAEPLTMGLRTGQVRDSIHALGEAVANLARRGRRGELMDLARTIGLVMPYTVDTLMQNRLGADVLSNNHWLQNNVSRFFIINGLTPLTHYQRAMMLPVANAFLLRLLRSDVQGKRGIYGAVRDKIDGEKGGYADGELNELGIPKHMRKDLLSWLDDVGGIPAAEDLWGPDQQMHKIAELWSRAVYRATTETIQDPLKSDRAIKANDPNYSAIYGIMSFIDAFTRNVIFRTLERGMKDSDGWRKKGGKMAYNVALAAAPALALYGGQVLTTILREAIFNLDQMEEKLEDDEFWKWVAVRGFDRTGMTGRLSPFINAVKGVRYETDLTSLYAGPYAAYFLNNIQDLLGPMSGRNAKSTNTSEYNASRAIYRAIVKPAIVTLLSGVAPMGPASVTASRAALAYLSARTTETGFADALVGEKGTKHVGDPPWWELGR